MLAEERFKRIMELLGERHSVSVQELTELLNTSESTIRRDLTVLHDRKMLVKVFGGATSLEGAYSTKDDPVENRVDQNREEKRRIAKYGASLICKNDFVFIDAGTTTELMIEYITEKEVAFVTDGIGHAKKLAQKGCQVFLLGGELKYATDAVVGGATLRALDQYNFTKGFFGTNGVHPQNGYSTPDVNEAMVKERAMQRCRERFVLADPSKFSIISSVTFGRFENAVVITTQIPSDRYRKYTNIWEADAK